MTKIALHSVTDRITNSSTTIYTYSDSSPQACEEMINEIFKVFGIEKKCSDIFNLVVLLDEDYHYEYWLKRNGSFDGDLGELIESVQSGKVEKPKWMFQAESDNESNCGSTLHISAKKPEYAEMAEKIKDFLYSTRSEEGSC